MSNQRKTPGPTKENPGAFARCEFLIDKKTIIYFSGKVKAMVIKTASFPMHYIKTSVFSMT